MSVIDKFLDVMKLGGDGYEDEYDDYDDFDDDYEDEKPRKKLFGRRGKDEAPEGHSDSAGVQKTGEWNGSMRD